MKTSKTGFVFALCAALWFGWSPANHGSTIAYTYDPVGRLVAADYGGGKSGSYAYDNSGGLIQAAQPGPGLIIGAVVAGQFTIAWSSALTGFVLESTTAQGPGAIWLPVGAVKTAVGNLNVVTLSAGPAKTFYRLHK